MSRSRTHRALRVLLTGLLAAGAVALPAAGAQAAPRQFTVSVTGGWNNATPLGTASGTVDKSDRTATYSVELCGRQAYASSYVTIAAGGASATHQVSNGRCETFSSSITSGSDFSRVTITVKSGTFYPGNTYTTYTKETWVPFQADAPVVTPVEKALRFGVTAKGGYNDATPLGTATGTITSTRGTPTARYVVNLCGDQTYPNSTVTITAGSARTSHTVSYSNCQTFEGTLTSSYGISSATVSVQGGTFYPGNTYRTYTKNTSVAF